MATERVPLTSVDNADQRPGLRVFPDDSTPISAASRSPGAADPRDAGRRISFGALHGIAVMLVLARLAAPLKLWLWPLGALCIALVASVQHPFFDACWSKWVGRVTHKPVTEDFVPVLPWLGVLLFGLAARPWLQRAKPGWLRGPLAAPARPLALLGRWSLSFYMLHPPVFIGLLLALQARRH